MNRNEVIHRLEEGLKIPVTNYLLFEKSISIKSGKNEIGGIPMYNVSGILTFDFSENILNWLKWEAVYEEYKTEINNAIDELFGEDKFVITLSTFRKLYLKEGDVVWFTVQCSYSNGTWTVEKI